MKKGISLVVLVITIIVLVILTGVVIIDSNYIVADAELSKLQSDIAELQTLMRIYKIRNSGNIPFDTVDMDISYLSEDVKKQFSEETISDDGKIQLYVIQLDKIDAEAVNYGTQKESASDRYLYSSVTGKVYYEQGLLVNGVMYYYIENGEG